MDTVTLIFPARRGLAVVAGKWKRLDTGDVVATFARNGEDELAVAMWVMAEIENRRLGEQSREVDGGGGERQSGISAQMELLPGKPPTREWYTDRLA